MLARARDDLLAGLRDIADAPARRPDRCSGCRGLQRLARQIEPPDRRILVDVAQDVGQLQRAAEMIGEAMPAFSSMPKMRTESRPTALATRSQ